MTPRLTAVPKSLRLVLLSCLMLFVELALIRWTGSNIVYLSYFSNFVLLGVVPGHRGRLPARAGAGRTSSPTRRWRWRSWSVFVLIFPVRIDRSGSDLIYFGAVRHHRPAGVAHPAVRLRGGRRRDGNDRRGRGADVRRVRAVGGLPATTSPASSSGSRPSRRCRSPGRRPSRGASWPPSCSPSPAPAPAARAAGGRADRTGLHARSRVARARMELVAVLQDRHLHPRKSSTDQTFIDANGVPHQIGGVGRGPTAHQTPCTSCRTSGHGIASLDDVLIVGAGTGTDVAIALAQGAQHVDAVEIDPKLQRIGAELHPDHPYQDPRVTVHINDGRAFLERTDATLRPDPVRAARLADAGQPAQSSLRLESYLFTPRGHASPRATT